jgi:hypothetical protein
VSADLNRGFGEQVKKTIYLFGVFALVLLATPAQASMIYSLDKDTCTGTCGTGPFGEVTLEQTTPTLVTVTVSLNPGEVFVGTGSGDALEFNIIAPITIGGFSAGFGLGPAPDKASAFGTFLESVTCTVCKGGNGDNPAGPLSFTITSVTGVQISDFGANAGGYFFAANILDTNGIAGNVAATATVPAPSVPEPVSASLIGIGLVAIGASRRVLRRH